MNPDDFDLIFEGSRALDKMVEAAHEYEVECGKWVGEDFNRWLIERYGVEYIASSARYHYRVVDPARYVFFLLKWP